MSLQESSIGRDPGKDLRAIARRSLGKLALIGFAVAAATGCATDKGTHTPTTIPELTPISTPKPIETPKISGDVFQNDFYSIKYPADWFIDPSIKDGNLRLVSVPPDQLTTPKEDHYNLDLPAGAASIDIGKHRYSDWTRSMEMDWMHANFGSVSSSSITINNLKGVKYILGPSKYPGMKNASESVKIVLLAGDPEDILGFTTSYEFNFRYNKGNTDAQTSHFQQVFDDLIASFQLEPTEAPTPPPSSKPIGTPL